MTAVESPWSPYSWKNYEAKQQPSYSDSIKYEQVLRKLSSLPPLVTREEVDRLSRQLRDVAEGKAFLLQGGDCAELFDYASVDPIESKLKVLLQMSLVIIWGSRIPVVRVARMAGQYAKPRSSPMENYNGHQIPSFRGDNINGYDPKDREPDPGRLVQAYFHSAATLNYVRTILGSGFADLHRPHNWDLHHVRSDQLRSAYSEIVGRLTDALQFMQTIGVDTSGSPSPLMQALNSVDLFMSHEGLVLDYESALTRPARDSHHSGLPPSNGIEAGPRYYNLSTHFLWIGDRTRALDGAHIEYFRNLSNPIGLKCGPTLDPKELHKLLDILDPNFEPGHVTLITRYGQDKVADLLPLHIKAVRESGHVVVWCCDPMHGNTKSSKIDPTLKTRHFSDIMSELITTISVHNRESSRLGGVHFELTGEKVTECIGGSMELTDEDLSTNYQTFCDPRLNFEQSLDIAFLISHQYIKARSTDGQIDQAQTMDGMSLLDPAKTKEAKMVKNVVADIIDNEVAPS